MERHTVRVYFELHFRTATGETAWRWGGRVFPYGICDRWKKYFIIESLIRYPWIKRNTTTVKLQYDEPERYWQSVFIGEQI